MIRLEKSSLKKKPANIIESESGDVRTAMGLHLRHKLFGDLVRDPRLIEPAYQLKILQICR